MAITVQETTDSLPLHQGIRDGYVEPEMTRKFIIQGAGNDPNQALVSNLGPLINMGYFTQSTQSLALFIPNGATRTGLGIAGSTVKMLAGSNVVIGTLGASQTVTLSADCNIGDTVILITGLTAARDYFVYTPVTPGTVAPSNTQGLYCLDRTLTPRSNADIQRNPIIDLVCKYGPSWRLAPNNIGVPQWSYAIQTENIHIQTALDSNDYPSGATDVGLAIGVQSDGSVQGCDVLAPKSIVTAKVKQRNFDASYQDAIESIVGTVNNSTFQGFAAGRLLFLGCVANQRGQGMFECEYSWLKQPAVSLIDFEIDGVSGVVSVSKTAHSYLWVRTGAKQAGGSVTQVTRDVHVATVYNDGDFSIINFNQ